MAEIKQFFYNKVQMAEVKQLLKTRYRWQKLSYFLKQCTNVQAFINIHLHNHYKRKLYPLVWLCSTCDQFSHTLHLMEDMGEMCLLCVKKTVLPVLLISETIKLHEQHN